MISVVVESLEHAILHGEHSRPCSGVAVAAMVSPVDRRPAETAVRITAIGNQLTPARF